MGAQALLAAAEGGGIIDFNVWTVVWAWAAFLVTVFALSRTAWPMLARKMEEREIRIAEGLAKAEEAERAAADLLRRQEEVLAKAKAEAQAILQEARQSAAHVRADALAQATKEIAEERERARREISLERAKALDELRRAAVELTLEAAGRVLERELRGEDQRRLAAEVIAKVDTLA